MKELCMLSAFLIIIPIAAFAQNNETGSPAQCSTSFGFLPPIDLSDYDIYKMVTNMCNFYHGEIGIWINIEKIVDS